jgi:CRAL/TRIO domain
MGSVYRALQRASLSQRKACTFGVDRAGCPVIYVDTGRHVVADVEWEETRRFVLFVVEHALAQAKEGSGDWGGIGRQFSVVLDLESFTLDSLDLDVPIYLFQMLSYNYPGQMRALLVVSESVLAWTLWNLVLPLMSEEAKSRIHWGLTHADLPRFIDPSQLPPRYGGPSDSPTPFPPHLADQIRLYDAQADASLASLPLELQEHIRDRQAAAAALDDSADDAADAAVDRQDSLQSHDHPEDSPDEEQDESVWGFIGSFLN